MLDFLTLREKQFLQSQIMGNLTEISFSDATAKVFAVFSYQYNMMFLGRTDKVYEQTWNLLASLHNGIAIKHGIAHAVMPAYNDPRCREMHPDASEWKLCFQSISNNVIQYIVGEYPIKKQPSQNILQKLFAKKGKL